MESRDSSVSTLLEQERSSNLGIFSLRRSIRQFSDDPVDLHELNELLEYIIKVTCSAGNLRAFHLHIVTNPDLRNYIFHKCHKQRVVGQAPVIIVVAADTDRNEHKYKTRSSFYATCDATIIANNILLALPALGLGGTYVGAFSDDLLANLGINQRTIAVLPIGYPDPNRRQRQRREIDPSEYISELTMPEIEEK
ncbi:hypothetical protein PCE1_002424 [Barthelona sp. PCE]